MKKLILLPAILIISTCSFSQQYAIKWGEEFKLRKGSTDLEVIYADSSGIYLQEGHMMLMSNYMIGGTFGESASLVKVDKNLSEIYRRDFNSELKGKQFVQFFVCRDKMFLFASEYSRRDKTLSFFAAEVNKKSGTLTGGWTPVTSFQKEEKKGDIHFKIIPNSDSTKIVFVSSVEGKAKNEYHVREFDNTMKTTGMSVAITNEFEPKKFQLEDVLYTNQQKIILVARLLEYEEGKKKKEKFLDFTTYNIRIYGVNGKQEAEINTNINGKWMNSARLQEKDKDLVLTAFYSNEKKGKTVDGLLVQRIDPASGKVFATSEKQINHSMLSTSADETATEGSDEDEESKAERKERERLDKIKDEGEGFSKYMQFRDIFYTSDGGLILLAEQYRHYVTFVRKYSTTGVNATAGNMSETPYSVYECGDILACKIDAAGNIGWLQVVPKAQRERILGYGGWYTNISDMSVSTGPRNFFDPFNMPFYGGFGAVQTGTSIQLIFNDHPKNEAVIQPGQQVKLITRFSKSDCFVLSIDETTGKCTRKFFFSNTDVPTAMPRLGSVIGKDMYIVGKEDRVLGKTKIAIAKISIK